MPLYELNLVLRPMPKQEIVDTIKRTANFIWANNGVIQKIEFLGLNKLPYAKPAKNEPKRYYEGNYFICKLSMNNFKIRQINPELKLDLDIIQHKFNMIDRHTLPENYECTLEDELLPPAYRKSVRPLLEDKNVYADVRR